MRLPASLRLGTATAATQIEGGCRTIDWWAFAEQPGRVANGDSPEKACDHWNLWQKDIELQTRLGMDAYRMSVEWGRIEPSDGQVDHHVLARYRDELVALRKAGIEPMVTLLHFSLPTWLSARGGVLAKDFAPRFEAFARVVAAALGDIVDHWQTFNEPNVLVSLGYMVGIWPPGRADALSVPRAILALRRAHHAAYAALHAAVPKALVGLAHHFRLECAASKQPQDRLAAKLLDVAFNRPFLDLPQDFIGLNYYTRDVIRFDPKRPHELFAERRLDVNADASDLGWEIYPQGLGVILRDLAQRKLPIWITENGIADAADAKRSNFLLSHLREVASAMADGVDVRGYLHWSLLDNFEWAEGYKPRFGLYAVDYETQARTLRPSGELYARIAKDREI